MTRKVKHYKTVRSALARNLSDLIRYDGVIYKGLGWLTQSCTILSLHYDDPCKIALNNGIWDLEVK